MATSHPSRQLAQYGRNRVAVSERQCLGQRLESLKRLEDEINAWEVERNAKKVKIVWQFGMLQTREKLRRHYPKLEPFNP